MKYITKSYRILNYYEKVARNPFGVSKFLQVQRVCSVFGVVHGII